jgi:hypothetical protein
MCVVSGNSNPVARAIGEDGVHDRLVPRFLLAFRLRFLGSGQIAFRGRNGRFSTALLGRPNGPWTGRESFTSAG